ncbi:hypothetical protein D3C72_1733780 [compost metagenome]
MRGCPEGAVISCQIAAEGKHLGVLAGGDSLRIDLYAERQRKRQPTAFVNVRPFFGQKLLDDRRRHSLRKVHTLGAGL